MESRLGQQSRSSEGSHPIARRRRRHYNVMAGPLNGFLLSSPPPGQGGEAALRGGGHWGISMGNAGAGRGSESEYNNKILLTVISPSVEITNASEEMDLV